MSILVTGISVDSFAKVKEKDVKNPELVNSYCSVNTNSPMREHEYCEIKTEGFVITVSGRTEHSYLKYRVAIRTKESGSFMFYRESFGDLLDGHYFEKTLDFTNERIGEYYLSVRFNADGSEVFSNESQMKYIPIIKTEKGIYIKRYSAIEKENKRVISQNKKSKSKYLDASMADMAHELRNGREWSKTDKQKLTAKEKKVIKDFAKKISKDAKDDYEKLLCFHDYIAENMYYDQPYNDASESMKRKMAKNGKVTLNPYDLVVKLKTGKKAKTVCNGFSTLFAALARSQGIPCRTVRGRANFLPKTEWKDLTTKELQKSTHIWNEVYVNKKWIVVDVTKDISNDYDGKNYTKPSPVVYRYSGFDPSEQSVAVNLLYLEYRE